MSDSYRRRAGERIRTADLPLTRSFHLLGSTAALLVSAGFLIVWLRLDVCGFRPVLARGRHGTGPRRSGARRSLPPCVNQCSLSGPRLRTGEPLTSLPLWCCPHWGDNTWAFPFPSPSLVPMKDLSRGPVWSPNGRPYWVRVSRAGAGKILPRPRRTVGGEKAGRPEPYKRGTGRQPRVDGSVGAGRPGARRRRRAGR
jgi:hypothetical protein